MKVAILVFLVVFGTASSAVRLDSFNVDPQSVTVSGLSAGGAMAMQMHVAFSTEIHGAGIFAGLAYSCAKAGLSAATRCMNSPGSATVNTLINEVNAQESARNIDETSNLRGSRVFVYHGTRDATVQPGAATLTTGVYQHFGADIETELTIAGAHGHPSDWYGAACSSASGTTQYINNCDYHGAYIGLNWLYNGTLEPPVTPGNLPGDFLTFDQAEFGGGSTSSMDTQGYVYIPSGCKDKAVKCKFHMAFHGCLQSKSNVQDKYATKAGYLEVGEKNNIIMLFPQAAASMLIGNPNACFDWWGYLSMVNTNFLNKQGAQMNAIYRMMQRVVNCDGQTPCYEDVTAPTTPITTTSESSGLCQGNQVSFHPGATCNSYIVCACGIELTRNCASGLYFDPSISECNFQQLVPCE